MEEFIQRCKDEKICPLCQDSEHYGEMCNPYGNGTLVPSDHWGRGCPADCEVHATKN
jgi:hypothetical protein